MPSTVHFAGREVVNNTAAQWWKDPGLRALTLHFFAILYGTFTIGYDGSVMGGFFGIEDFMRDMHNPDANQQGAMTCGIFIGMTFIAIPAQYLGDKIGRRRTSQLGGIFTIIGVLVQVFAVKGRGVFLLSRIIIGIGNGFPLILGATYAMELAHPRLSSKFGAWFGGGYFIGGISAAWITFGCLWISSNWSWRLPSILQLFPAIYQVIALQWVPESPRWLVANNREGKALDILAKYHANGDENDELVKLELAEIKASLALENGFRYRDFLKTSGNRKRLFIAIFVGALQNFAGNGMISYYLIPVLSAAGITDAVKRQGISGSLQIWTFIVAIFAVQYSQTLGRRRLWLLSVGGCLLSYIGLTICSALYAEQGNQAAGSASVAFIFTFNGAYVAALTVLAYSYVSELMPYHARNKASSVHELSCCIAGIANAYMNPVAFAAISWKYYTIYIAVLVVSFGIVYFVFPETAHLTLEESAHVLDGADAQSYLVHATAAELAPGTPTSEKVGAKSLVLEA
ncbi:hypothetical protein JCM8097_008255 [Rhodosporidiobolus ruineniae]